MDLKQKMGQKEGSTILKVYKNIFIGFWKLAQLRKENGDGFLK
jgi:hypothetical protein